MNKLIIFLILSLLWLNGFGQRSTANDVALYCRMETTSFLDESSNDNDGTNSGVTIVSGKVNNCGSFGSGDYIDFSNCDISDAITLSGWVYMADNGANVMLSQRTSGNSLQIYSPNGGYKLQMLLWGTSITSLATTSDVLTVNTWHYITGTYDGSNMKLYVDAVEEATAAATGTLANIGSVIKCGTDDPGGSEYFNGKIDEIIIYLRALSLIEIKNHYAGGDGLFYITENLKNEKINFGEYCAYVAEYYTCTN